VARKRNFMLWLLALGLAVCGARAAQRPSAAAGRGVFRQVPETGRARQNPYEKQEAALRAGRKLFKRHCAECHGEDARGSARAPSLRAPEVQDATPGELQWFLKNGELRAGMPSWSRLPDERLWQIVTYVQSLGEPPARR
jgi:mono/diheme cytochrome c family protein